MNQHILRIIVGNFVAILVFTALLLLIPATSLVIAAYCVVLFAIIEFTGTLCYVGESSKKNYLTNAAFVLVTRRYAVIAILFSIMAAMLENWKIYVFSTKWFIFIQIVFAAIMIWRMLALRSGQQMVEEGEQEVVSETKVWHVILTEAEAILRRAEPATRKRISEVRDAIRYASPVTLPELAPLEESIRKNVALLGWMDTQQRPSDVETLCKTILQQIGDRNTKAKLKRQ